MTLFFFPIILRKLNYLDKWILSNTIWQLSSNIYGIVDNFLVEIVDKSNFTYFKHYFLTQV